jgi:hypothetical protein
VLRGWTKSRAPDSEPPYRPWYLMPFREVRDPQEGTMELTFDNDLQWNGFSIVTKVKVQMYPGLLTKNEVQRLRNVMKTRPAISFDHLPRMPDIDPGFSRPNY